VARQSRMTGTAGQAPTSEAIHTNTAKVTNRVVLGRRPRGVAAADVRHEEEHTAEVGDKEGVGEARHIVMTESESATTAVTQT
jgi:hypothetical protein